jgi:hypothetical protein
MLHSCGCFEGQSQVRRIIAMTSAFLLLRSAAGLPEAFLAPFTFFAGLACLVAFAFFTSFVRVAVPPLLLAAPSGARSAVR